MFSYFSVIFGGKNASKLNICTGTYIRIITKNDAKEHSIYLQKIVGHVSKLNNLNLLINSFFSK
jgi:hypothetical protein